MRPSTVSCCSDTRLLSCPPQKRAGPAHQGPKFIERLVAKQKSRPSELLTNEASVGLEFEHSLNTLWFRPERSSANALMMNQPLLHLVSDQFSIHFGNASRRDRFPQVVIQYTQRRKDLN